MNHKPDASQTTEDLSLYTREEMREACRNNYNAGWHRAVAWLRERADSHAGRWMTMEPREALKDAAREMETINV